MSRTARAEIVIGNHGVDSDQPATGSVICPPGPNQMTSGRQFSSESAQVSHWCGTTP